MGVETNTKEEGVESLTGKYAASMYAALGTTRTSAATNHMRGLGFTNLYHTIDAQAMRSQCSGIVAHWMRALEYIGRWVNV